MSDKNTTPLNDSESTKKLEQIARNYINMLEVEKSDYIKLSYFQGLSKTVQKLPLSPDKIVEIIFKNILFEKTDIIKSPNVLLSFISFCRKTDNKTFLNYFYDLLYKFLGDYEENRAYFKDYLIILSLEIFFDSIKKNEDEIESRKKFLNLMIDTDIKEFKDQLLKMIINEKIKLMDNKIKINFLINFLEIIIIKNKYQIGITLLKLIKEEIKENLPDEIIDNILNFENKNGFNSIIKKKKNRKMEEKSSNKTPEPKNYINEFLAFNQIIIENISPEFLSNKNNETKLDIYLSNLINILCIKKEFNVEIIKYIFEYFIKYKSTMLKKILPISIYYLSNFAYTNNQIELLFNVLCKSNNLAPIYKWIIFKNQIIFNKASTIQTDFKPSLKSINISIEENKKVEKDIYFKHIIEKAIKVNEEESNLYLLILLTLYDCVINSSFKNNENNYIINFYSLKIILEYISNLTSEQINNSFYNNFIQFLLDYMTVLYEYCTSINNDKNEKIILETFKKFFQIFGMVKSKEVQLSIIFPSIINLASNKNIKIDFLEPVIDYIIDVFSRESRQNKNIFKIIKGSLFNKEQKNPKYRFSLANKLIDLVIKANEHKLFELLFSLCNELLKTKDDFDLKLNYYIINKYSKYYEGALSDLLQKYIIEKFDENYLQKELLIKEIAEEKFYIINTIDNIYCKDKNSNLMEIIDKFYGDEYVKIISIFNNLFEYMNKDENNKDIFKCNIKDDNLFDEYYSRKKNVEEILDFYSFIKKDYDKESEDSNYKPNKKIYCIYGTTYYLVHLLSQYLFEKIENEKKMENEEEKKLENDKLMIIFDYLYENVLLNKNLKNITFKSFFYNIFLSNKNILDYYLVKHTNNLANSQIKEKELNYAQLNQISVAINLKKSLGIITLLKTNHYNIILMSKLIINLFDYESHEIINPQNVDLYKQHSSKYLVIKNIYSNNILNKINDYYSNINNIDKKNNNNQSSKSSNNSNIEMRINACFSKKFFKYITDISNMKNLENFQIYYLFCLDYEIFHKYYNSFNDFFDFDYTILQFYSLARNQKCKFEFKEKYLEFLKNFIFVESVNVFILRIFSEEKTFHKIFSKSDDHSEKEISLLHDIVISLFNILLKYNSYQIYTEKIILNIINNVFSFINDILPLEKSDDEEMSNKLNYLGDLIYFIFKQFSTENKNNLNINKNIVSLTGKINSNLIKNINKELEDKYKNSNNKNNTNQKLINFIKSQGNLDEENKKKRMFYMDNNFIIEKYSNNPEKYPFPIEQFMKKFCDNK